MKLSTFLGVFVILIFMIYWLDLDLTRFSDLAFILTSILFILSLRVILLSVDKLRFKNIDKKTLPDEFSQTGGIRIGLNAWIAMNATWPFATLTASREKITIATMWKNYHFNKEEIKSLKKYDGFINLGLKIEHNKEYSPFVVFWTFCFSELKLNLENLGYKVTE